MNTYWTFILSLVCSLLLCYTSHLDAQSRDTSAFDVIIDLSKEKNVINDTVVIFDDVAPDYTEQLVGLLIEYDADLKAAFESTGEVSRKALAEAYQNSKNPFICQGCPISFLPPNQDFSLLLNETDAANAVALGGTSSPFSITKVADALAIFLVGRVKRELSASVFADLQKQLDKYPEIETLFPETHFKLKMIDREIYNWKKYLTSMNNAFKTDLQVLPRSLSNFVEQHPELIKSPFDRAVISDGLEVAQLFLEENSPDSVLTYLASDISQIQRTKSSSVGEDSTTIRLLQSSFRSIDMLSKTLLSSDSNQIWIRPREFFRLVDDRQATNLFLGLLYQKAAGANYQFRNTSFRDIIGDDEKGAYFINHTALEFIRNADQANQAFRSIKYQRKAEESVSYYDYFQFIEGTLKMAKVSTSLVQTIVDQIDPDTSRQHALLQSIDQYADHLLLFNKVALDVGQKNYPSAILNMTQLLTEIMKQTKKGSRNIKIIANINKYGMLAANMASAESTPEMVAALEAAALPPGSSIVKKKHEWTLELGAYVGFYFGSERLTVRDSNGIEGNSNGLITAISAPLGLSINKRIKRSSLSLFGSVIDIGALTAFRFNDSETEALPEFKFENIFAPGAHLVWGVPRYPLALGAGFQYGPTLRKITAEKAEVVRGSSFRFGLFATVDIPIISLYRSRR